MSDLSRDRRPGGGHTVVGRMLYPVLWGLCRTLAVAVFGFRSRFAEPLPGRGGLLLISSHQSFLDPVFVGLAADRRLSFLARGSLYRFGPFGSLITALDAVPIDRDGSTLRAMKAVIDRLRRGAAVVVFPEGSRTHDGRLGEFKSGFALIAKRAAVPVVPVAIVGGFECWPRSRLLPRPGRVRVEFGEVVPAEEIAALGEQEVFELCVRSVRELDARARAARAGRRSGSAGRTRPTASAR